jgi:signal transduction histidine kinase
MMADPVTLSREFRSLVAAIRGPLDEELADRTAPTARRERIKTLHRNFTRLLQLVNTLFDLTQSETRHHGSDLVDSAAPTLIIPTLRDVEPATQRMPVPEFLDDDD